MNKYLTVLLVILLVLCTSFADANNKCSEQRNAFYCALVGTPCLWKPIEGECIEIKSKQLVVETQDITTTPSACSLLTQSICEESKDIGCYWNNDECVKQQVSKSFCKSIKTGFKCIVANCKWINNKCFY